jgi:predicted Zn-dependent protease
MNRKHSFAPLALALTLALGLTGSACAQNRGGLGNVNLVSVEDEWRLGQQLERDLAGKLRLVNDRTALAYVDGIVQKLVRGTQLGRMPWETHLVADSNINAFNIPGGHVYVNTGLIAAADDVSELAGVLAHEVAHGVERHGTEQLTKAQGFNLIAGLALGRTPSMSQQILAQLVGAGTFAHFGRNAEREADMLGVHLMHRAGYDPRGMASMFRELLENRRSRPGKVAQFFSSHPLTENRIQAVEAEAASLPRSERLVRNDSRYRNVQSRVAGR